MAQIIAIIALVAIVIACIFGVKWRKEKESRIYAEEELIKSQNKCANLDGELMKVRSNALVTLGKLYNLQDRIIEIEDTAPKGNRPVDNVLCLQDKLKHYVRRDGTKVRLTILK